MTVHPATDVLLDHVSAYATAVRSFVSDLAPELVDDLTDGLEADLAEALEDPDGPVATGGAVGAATDDRRASMIDLTRRFGPAVEYAAELRAAAGLPPAVPPDGRHHRTRDGARGLVTFGRRKWDELTAPLRTSPGWQVTSEFFVSLRPVWWLARGWMGYHLATGLWPEVAGSFTLGRYLPTTTGAWLLLGVLLFASVSVGRGLGRAHPVSRRAVAVLSVAAVVALPTVVGDFRWELERRLAAGGYPVYVETPVYREAPGEDGVRVDGMLVSNLFVYDAEGNPLSGVQIFDDRGRPVRTTYDDGWQSWSLPGVDEPWSFVAAVDSFGRDRWNVYPLAGAPSDQWRETDTGDRELAEGTEPLVPPAPFAKAPPVEAVVQPDADDAAVVMETTSSGDG